ncbi:hypothetical protein JCM19237_5311 [Photobacterium aphoticum]|uniref:Uncharacterized protein n=1 Tax=Photobacterium aphoticum TaxID=754436 RepID=A0A090QJJ2_9GAMM|nr:hypothetical protein JCM19237_5311 [Photobacterium aphoticum]
MQKGLRLSKVAGAMAALLMAGTAATAVAAPTMTRPLSVT